MEKVVDEEMADLCKLEIPETGEESLSQEEDGEIDFVLVWRDAPSDPLWTKNK